MKTKFNIITSTCVPLPLENVDTDQIIPARFLKATTREEKFFGDNLFRDWRYNADGSFCFAQNAWSPNTQTTLEDGSVKKGNSQTPDQRESCRHRTLFSRNALRGRNVGHQSPGGAGCQPTGI